jgi:hypothetical protein
MIRVIGDTKVLVKACVASATLRNKGIGRQLHFVMDFTTILVIHK